MIDLKTEIKSNRKKVEETVTEFAFIQHSYQEASRLTAKLTKERDDQQLRYENLSVQMANVSHKVRVDEQKSY